MADYTKYISIIQGNEYLMALAVFIISIVVLRIFKFIILKKLEDIAKKTSNDLDDLVIKIMNLIAWPFYFLVSLFLALQFLSVPEIIDQIVYYGVMIFGTYYGVRIVQILVDYTIDKIVEKRKEEDVSVINLLRNMIKIILWVVAALLILGNLGYDITSLLAGLGIGGIAIAFALQNILVDVFASFSIYFDKPFKKGDYIVIGSDGGTVKEIGIKSTRLQALQGQELIVSNRELTETRVHNYKRMKNRRIVFTFGITYETATAKMKKIPEMVTKVITSIPKARADRVHFKTFGDSALIYEVVYFVNDIEYNTYMDINEKINLGIKEAFEKAKIDMAYPTQTLYINKFK